MGTFSDIILVQFGQRAKSLMRLETETNEGGKIPCPTLEFRIVNSLYDKAGCEIIDATLNCVVINADTSDGDFKMKSMFLKFDADKDEVNYSFANMNIDTPNHPFFKRIWIARHILNHNSPILTSRAKRAVLRNNGYWPKELNSYDGVRSSIKFDQIVVNLSGTSNISASPVYAQKIYEDFDMSVGYQFVNIVYRGKKCKRMMLDMNMINDITEQDGGGSEPMDENLLTR